MFWIISIPILLVFLFFFAFGHFLFRQACGRRKKHSADHSEHSGGHGLSEEHRALISDARAWFDAQEFESVAIPSHDGLCLRGKLLCHTNARGAILFFHGYHSSARRDFALQAKLTYEAGYHILLVSERSHGESEGKYTCFGTKERFDVRDWAHFAQKRFGELPLALFGLSMGGASVLMSASTDLPSSVRALISDCGFSSPWKILARTLRTRHKLYPFPSVYFLNFWARTLGGFDFRECTVEEAHKNSSLPTLLIHGDDDRLVPVEMSIMTAEAFPDHTELLIVKDARHGQAMIFAAEKYQKRLLDFLEKNL